jgi:transcriptional regulator with XRE-family HTH domain
MLKGNFKKLQATMTPEARKRADAKYRQLIQELALDELRAARDLTQEELARTLGVNQPAVSRIERKADMYVSTLANFVKAMGGKLEIRAVFPDGEVRISQFSDLEKVTKAAP